MFDLKQLFRLSENFIMKNSPTIMTALGASGLIATAVLASKATLHAESIIDRASSYENPPETNVDKFKLVWKEYIPTVIVGSLSVACIISSNSVNLRRNAALASVYTLTERTLTDYKEEVKNLLGDAKATEIKDRIAEKRLKEDPVTSHEVLLTGKGEMLCYDSLTGRYFNSDVESLRHAQNELNAELYRNTWASLNDFYTMVGLPETRLGESLGWVADNMVELDFSSKLAEDGTPCLVMDYRVEPKENYYRSI